MSTTLLRITSICFLVLAAGLYFYTDNQQQYYQSRALPAAKQLLSEVASWDKQVLLKHLSQQARETISDEQLEQLLVHYREFGVLQSVGELNFSRLISVFSLFGDKRINYSGAVQFDSGSAQVNITLIETSSSDLSVGYEIYNLTIRR